MSENRWDLIQVWQQGEKGKAKKMRRNCTDGKGKEFMHDFETTTWKAEMEEFSDADTAAEAEEAENTEFNEVTE